MVPYMVQLVQKNLGKKYFRDISIPSIIHYTSKKTPKYDIYMESYVDILSLVDTTAPDALYGIWVQKLNSKNLLF